MPTYMLEGSARVELSARPLEISLVMEGPAEARIDVFENDALVPGVVRPRPDLVIVPGVTNPLTLRLVPVGGGSFPAGSIGHVSVRVNAPGALDPERAVLEAVHVEGLASRDVLQISKSANGLEVAALLGQTGGASTVVELEPLASTARVHATELLGVQRVAPDELRPIAVAVDSSASFRSRIADGSAAAVLALIEGVASVLGEDSVVPAVGLGARATVLNRSDENRLSSVLDELAGTTPGTGLSHRVIEQPLPANDARGVVIVVSDDLPADFERASDATTAWRRHPIIIGHRSAWEVQGPIAGSHTLVDWQSVRGQTAEQIASNHGVVRAFVTSLVNGIRVETEAAR